MRSYGMAVAHSYVALTDRELAGCGPVSYLCVLCLSATSPGPVRPAVAETATHSTQLSPLRPCGVRGTTLHYRSSSWAAHLAGEATACGSSRNLTFVVDQFDLRSDDVSKALRAYTRNLRLCLFRVYHLIIYTYKSILTIYTCYLYLLSFFSFFNVSRDNA